MRATIHNARTGKNGVFSSKHNDRNFNTDNTEHIDNKKSADNFYWHCMQAEHPDFTFEEAESAFYEKYCRKHLDAQNLRYEASRHKERIKTMDEYRNSPQTCPEEVIWMIGKQGDTIPSRMLKNIVSEQIEWEQNAFPGLRVLDVALHMDESTPHIHERRIWLYTDNKGYTAVGQNKSLEQMGINIPHPENARGRYNNRKQTFTRLCRKHFLELCKKHGLEINEVPQEACKSGNSLLQYQALQEQEKINMLNRELVHLKASKKVLSSQVELKRKEYFSLNNQIKNCQSQLNELNEFLHQAEQRRAFEIFCERELERKH